MLKELIFGTGRLLVTTGMLDSTLMFKALLLPESPGTSPRRKSPGWEKKTGMLKVLLMILAENGVVFFDPGFWRTAVMSS